MLLILAIACSDVPTRSSGLDADTDAGLQSPPSQDAATSSDTDVPHAPSGDPCAEFTCEVGLGTGEFQLANPGDSAVLVHGAQGGWHVDLGLRTTGGASVVSLRPTVRVVDDEVVLAGGEGALDTFNQALAETGTCSHLGQQIRAILDDRPDQNLASICALEGVDLELSFEVSTFDGLSTRCSVVVVAQLDAIDQEACSSL